MQILISIHALLAESDTVTARIIDPTYDFYPRSPCGERLGSVAVVSRTWNFYPRSPCGERQSHAQVAAAGMAFLSTLSLRRATLPPHQQKRRNRISIHALLAESDFNSFSLNINGPLFLSTLSLRRATVGTVLELQCILDFYPRSPCGERRRNVIDPDRDNGHFYPRSPCGERLRVFLE